MGDVEVILPKRMNRDAKAVIQAAFEGIGGVQRLTQWANDPKNIAMFYSQIWSKIIPKEVKNEHTGNVNVTHTEKLRTLSDGELDTWLKLAEKCDMEVEDDLLEYQPEEKD